MNKKKSWDRPADSRTSPRGGKNACLCADHTYHRDCCDGSMHAQGVGQTEIPRDNS
jgi:hypothetical protein|tara:strand:+ start:10200 stop:10367 length:168 start_codon:yes stop_codon:yes gene_type:complete